MVNRASILRALRRGEQTRTRRGLVTERAQSRAVQAAIDEKKGNAPRSYAFNLELAKIQRKQGLHPAALADPGFRADLSSAVYTKRSMNRQARAAVMAREAAEKAAAARERAKAKKEDDELAVMMGDLNMGPKKGPKTMEEGGNRTRRKRGRSTRAKHPR